LVPLDFSGKSRQAFRCAVPLAEKFGARLILIHVLPLPTFDAVELGIPLPDQRASRRAAHERLRATARDALPAALPVSCHVLLGHAATEIVAAARRHRADLIVLSTKGRSGLRRLVLGSTAESVVRHAHCPVLAVRRQTS
jgi:nucleotide-binding universal stress UspA family protein